MAKLILSMDGLVLKEIPLNKERLTIGRKPHNDVQIDNLAISGEHAVIVTILNDSFLEDLNSTNGTLVNGQSIKKHVLRNNDLIELGKYRLKYMADAVVADQGGESDRASSTRTIHTKRSGELQLQQGEAQTRSNFMGAGKRPAPGGLAAVQLLNGPSAGKELDLTKTLTTLGKPGAQVAVIAKRPQGYFITHVEGDQPTLVNGQALDAQARQLEDHDVVEIGGIKMEFFYKL